MVPPLIAHPLLEPGRLEIPPAAAAALAAVLVAAVARFWPAPGETRRDEPAARRPVASWDGRLTAPEWAGRVLAILVLALAIGAGRLGTEDELDNIAPALIVGAGVPLVLLAALVLRRAWRWLDPWDGAARLLGGGDDEEERTPGVWWAIAPAVAWTAYLAVDSNPYHPRLVGFALGIYTIVTVAGCLLFGRRGWLARAEVFGLVASWAGEVRRRSWMPPVGAEVVLGVLGGGFVFASVRYSRLWGSLNVGPSAGLFAAAGLLVLAGAFGTLLWFLERRGREEGAPGGVAVVAVPSVIGIALALAMHRDVLFTSLAFLPGLVADPFGLGWNLIPWRLPLFGLCSEASYTCALAVGVRFGVVLAGGVLGAVFLGRRVDPSKRQAGMSALALLTAGGIVAVTAS